MTQTVTIRLDGSPMATLATQPDNAGRRDPLFLCASNRILDGAVIDQVPRQNIVPVDPFPLTRIVPDIVRKPFSDNDTAQSFAARILDRMGQAALTVANEIASAHRDGVLTDISRRRAIQNIDAFVLVMMLSLIHI